MSLQSFLEQKNMSMYHLSKISGVPKTTVIDICTGKSSIFACNVGTVLRLSQALGLTIEDLLSLCTLEARNHPEDKSYLENGLPEYLLTSLDNMKKSWKTQDSGKKDYRWDLYWCELNADINSAETDQIISTEQANYLRKKYLRMNCEE